MSANAALFVFVALLCLHAASAYRPTTEAFVDENGHVVDKLSSKEEPANEVFEGERYTSKSVTDVFVDRPSDCEKVVCAYKEFVAWDFCMVCHRCRAFKTVPEEKLSTDWVRGVC